MIPETLYRSSHNSKLHKPAKDATLPHQGHNQGGFDMAFFRKQQLNGKWYARAVNRMRPATTDEVADELALMSTVSRGDTYAVLCNLGKVIGRMMADGRSVKLKGIGTFYLTCQTKGKGTNTPEELTARLITDVRVRFIPEYERGQNHKVTRRSLIHSTLKWIDADET